MEKEHKAQVLVLGSGPAGSTAAIYAARSGLETILVQGMQPGGQLTTTTKVENFPAFPDGIQGPELVSNMIKQAENVGAKLVEDQINKFDLSSRPYKFLGESGATYIADTVIIAIGAKARWLGLESEEKFKGFGVSSCATCDGFFFRDKEIIVVGGGNSAVEEALYLTKHASKVNLVVRGDSLKAEQVMQDRLFANEKIDVIWDSSIIEVLGTDEPRSVTGAKIQNNKTNEISEIAIDGIFVAIGYVPNTDLLKDTGVEINKWGYLVTKPDSCATSLPGVFAAGDAQDSKYKQAIVAAGNGCIAALEARKFIEDGQHS